MEQHLDSTSVRGMALTASLWMLARVTASDVATYCTILSAIVTIIVNIQKFKSGKRSGNSR
jgi:hypothetical protein